MNAKASAPEDFGRMTVTQGQYDQIRAEVEKFTKTTPAPGEDDVTYALRLMAASQSKIDDDDWETLSEDTQRWLNETQEANDKGWTPALPDDHTSPDTVAEESEVLDKQPKAKNMKPKAPPKDNKISAPRGRPSIYGLEDRVKVLCKGNPHRPDTKSYVAFSKITDGGTVNEQLEAGVPLSYLRYAQQERNLIQIG